MIFSGVLFCICATFYTIGSVASEQVPAWWNKELATKSCFQPARAPEELTAVVMGQQEAPSSDFTTAISASTSFTTAGQKERRKNWGDYTPEASQEHQGGGRSTPATSFGTGRTSWGSSEQWHGKNHVGASRRSSTQPLMTIRTIINKKQ